MHTASATKGHKPLSIKILHIIYKKMHYFIQNIGFINKKGIPDTLNVTVL